MARKARVRRPAAPPKLESELGAMEARGRPGEGAPLPSETVRTRRSPPRPEPGKEGRPRLLRETLEAARPGDSPPPPRDAARPAPIPAWRGARPASAARGRLGVPAGATLRPSALAAPGRSPPAGVSPAHPPETPARPDALPKLRPGAGSSSPCRAGRGRD